MRLLGKPKLLKLKRKNRGNAPLNKAIDKWIDDVQRANWKNQEELKVDRTDADCVHDEGFYFFDLNIHRTMALVEFSERGEDGEEDDAGIVQVLWVGSHDEYERVFKNNKRTIEKWLRDNGHINN